VDEGACRLSAQRTVNTLTASSLVGSVKVLTVGGEESGARRRRAP
jgi:hypothetical protein